MTMTVVDRPVRDLLSMQEACALLGVSPATLRRWSDAGDVTAFTTPGGHRRFARDDIADLLVRSERGRVQPPEAPRPASSLLAVVAHARTVPSVAREQFATELETYGVRANVLVLHTCQRVEVYVSGDVESVPLPPLPHGTATLRDADAVRHLISVACGLESAVLGEDQVLHQVRASYAARKSSDPLDPVLDRMVQVALRAGRKAHGWFGSDRRSLADVALDRIEASAGSVTGRRVLVVGAGAMATLAARVASRRGAEVVVTNRTPARASALAREVGGHALDWGAPAGRDLAGVVVAVSGPWPVDGAWSDQVATDRTPLVDLSSPPATPPALQRGLGELFVGVDDLAWGAETQLAPALRDRVESLVSDSGRDFCRWLRGRGTRPTLQRLTEAVDSRRHAELEWLMHRLPDLDERERAMVEQMSHRLVAAILHAPRAALADDPTGELDRAARAIFGV